MQFNPPRQPQLRVWVRDVQLRRTMRQKVRVQRLRRPRHWVQRYNINRQLCLRFWIRASVQVVLKQAESTYSFPMRLVVSPITQRQVRWSQETLSQLLIYFFSYPARQTVNSYKTGWFRTKNLCYITSVIYDGKENWTSSTILSSTFSTIFLFSTLA